MDTLKHGSLHITLDGKSYRINEKINSRKILSLYFATLTAFTLLLYVKSNTGVPMKQLVTIFSLLFISFTVLASDLSSSCSKKIMKYRSTIIHSASMIHYYHNVSVNEGNPGYTELQLTDADSISAGIRSLENKQKITERQLLVLSKVCELNDFSSDTIFATIETLN